MYLDFASFVFLCDRDDSLFVSVARLGRDRALLVVTKIIEAHFMRAARFCPGFLFKILFLFPSRNDSSSSSDSEDDPKGMEMIPSIHCTRGQREFRAGLTESKPWAISESGTPSLKKNRLPGRVIPGFQELLCRSLRPFAPLERLVVVYFFFFFFFQFSIAIRT